MKVQFLGTGAAEGFPAEFCSCPACQKVKNKKKEYRTRSQVLVDGVLSIDFPPEAYMHTLQNGVDLSALPYALITHSHMDHFYAHDFILRGYKYAKSVTPVLNLYGNREVSAVFTECTRREMKAEVAPHVQMNTVCAYQEFNVGDYRVLTVPARHSLTEEALLYYVEGDKGYMHFYDTGLLTTDEPFIFLQEHHAKIDIIAFDCTFMEQTGGSTARHMGIEDVMQMLDKFKQYGLLQPNAKIVLTHFSHNADPTRRHTKALAKKYGCIAAYDGMTITL